MLAGQAGVVLLTLGIAACAATPPQSGTHSSATVGVTSEATPQYGAARLTSVAMISPRRGYGLFEVAAGSRCQALSGQTSDGGAQFESASPITSWNCSGYAAVGSVATDDQGAVFAYGPQLFISWDGGSSWRREPQPGTVLAVSPVGRSVWLLLATCPQPGTANPSCRLRLLMSGNAGRSWHPSPVEPARATSGLFGIGLGATAGQTWLLRTGQSAGYVFSFPVGNPAGKPDKAPLWYTANGGHSWSPHLVPCGFDALADAVAVAPGHVLAAVCAGQPGAGNQGKSVAISTDGGRSWHLTVVCSFLRPCHAGALTGGYLGQIAALSARKLFLAGDRSSLAVTTDGGRYWQNVLPLIGDGSAGTYEIVFFGPAAGLVVGAGGNTNGYVTIWHTANGGRTWHKVPPHLT